MKKIGKVVCKNKWLILIITLILTVPALIGYVKTDINYDILVYLPDDIETLKGEHILTNDFNMGAFSLVIVDNMENKEILSLEEKFKNIDSVTNVISINDITGVSIPLEMLPSEIKDKVAKENSRLILVTFKTSTSDTKTLDAVQQMRDIVDSRVKIGGMSAMVLDTKELFNSEMLLYVVIAVILCIIVLELSLDSYLVPILLMINIGISILFNMGSNIIFGNISYITKAIAAVLQLGVTTDFSIFLYHKYENFKKEYKDKEKAMENAISDTLVSVFGSSLTTIAGFLALCTMKLTLGTDIGLVMSKGVLLGVICVITVFPALLLLFDKQIEKSKHKELLPKFNSITNFVMKHYVIIFIIFLVLLVPAYFAQNKTEVYYKLDSSIPEDYGYSMASKTLKEDYGMVSESMILVDKNMPDYKINEMVLEIESLDGINKVINPASFSKSGIDQILPLKLKNVYETDKYKMIIISSSYDIATNELNNQVDQINKIIKKYDKNSILAGEGALMKDLVTTTDIDFNNVNFVSIGVIFILMMIVLKSISLPILLVTAIEFAIFINMGVPYFTGTQIPFIASVVIGTIQLGATIDYAILLTTRYLEERKTKDKKIAIKTSLENSINSIFVSAMCFFGATIGVGVVSKIDMIGSLCTLIARGAIISMLVVIMVVPSILIIFDKIIINTTLGMKGKKNMKKINKIILPLVLSLILVPTNALALTKDETVYAKLNSDGSINNIIVNEHLINDENKDTLEDMSNLSDILNLNGDNTFIQNENNLTWNSNGQDIFYQGTIDKKLPVLETITYKLDGESIALDELIGKNGRVEITIKYTNTLKNSVLVNGKKESLYTPFVVTTSTIIDGKNKNIKVTNGKVVDNGTNYMVVGLSAPGLYESLLLDSLKSLDTITISYDTDAFELSSIYSVITPKLLDSSDLEVFDKMDSVYKNVNKLQTSMNQIESGSKTILEGLDKLELGSSKIYENLNTVLDKLELIKDGTISLDNGLKQILTELENAKILLENSGIEDKIESIKVLIDVNNKTIKKLEDGNKLVLENYEKYNLKNMTYEYIINLPYDDDTKNNLINIKSTYENTYQTNKQIIELLNKDNYALNSSIEAFNSTSNSVNSLVTNLDYYLKQLESGASELSSGTSLLKDGVSALNQKMGELKTGTIALKEGMNVLNNGINTFNKDGINQISTLASKTKKISSKVEALIKLGNDYNTFTLSNTKSNTKFIYLVDSKKEIIDNKIVKEDTKKDTFLDRVKNLFK